jgi:L-ribulokinase
VPDPQAHAVYNRLYALYKELHDEFGGVRNSDLASVMKRLLEIRGES